MNFIMEGKHYCYISQELTIYNPQNQSNGIILVFRMAKKINKKQSKKIKRASSMEKCLRDAEDYLKRTKAKKIFKTKSIMKTIQEAKNIISAPRTTPKKAKKAKKRASIISKPAISLPALPASLSTRPTLAVPKYAGTSVIRKNDVNKTYKTTKATIFNSKINPSLPLPDYGFIDICFCLDATGSMAAELAQVQSTIVAIIKKIQSKVRTEGITLRFGIVSYRDHPPQDSTYVTLIKDFTDAYDAINYVNKLQAYGGGDEPEAVHDGLMDCCQKLNWVDMKGIPTLRYIFHVADAPPHGKEFLNPEPRNGCICGLTTEEVVREINKMQIHYRLIKTKNNVKLDKMQEIFQKSIDNMESTQLAHAYEMDIRVSDMIVYQLAPETAIKVK